MKKLLLAIPIVVFLAAGCNSSQLPSDQSPVTQKSNPLAFVPAANPAPAPNAALAKPVQNLSAMADVSVKITAPSTMVIGKTYQISWAAGKSISAIEVKFAGGAENGAKDSIYTANSVHGSGTFQWLVPASSYEGEYVMEITGKTADYDATANKIDQLYKAKPADQNQMVANYQQITVLQQQLKAMSAAGQAKFTILKKDLPPISASSISNIVKYKDNFDVQFEWQSLPAGMAVGSRLKFIYSQDAYLARTCTVEQDQSTKMYFCHTIWSDYLSDSTNKDQWAIFIDDSVPGTAASRDEKRIADIKQLAAALQQYKTKNGSYPQRPGWNSFEDGSSTYNQANVIFPDFMGVHYEDPLGQADKVYGYLAYFDSGTFVLYAQMENSFKDGDPDFYCTDSQGLQVLTSKRPKPITVPLSCNNLWPN